MFIFSACLLVYAGILALSKDYKIIARYWASDLKIKRDQKKYSTAGQDWKIALTFTNPAGDNY